MLKAAIKSAQTRRATGQRAALPAWFSVVFQLLLSVSALAAFVVGVFVLAGAWGFIALGVALVLLEWRVDSDG